MQTPLEHLPPQNIEAEESVLAAVLNTPDLLSQAIEILSPSDFYRTAHQEIFQACLGLHHKSEPADLLTVTSHLRDHEKLKGVGGATYLSRLLHECPVAPNVEHYCRLIKDKAILRQTIFTAHNIIQFCHSENHNVQEVVDNAQRAILKIESGSQQDTFTSLKDLSVASIDRYEQIAKSPTHITGLPSGYPDLDNATCGFQSCDLIILAARPSMGKTALAMNMVVNMGVPIAVFSLEMAKEPLYDRTLASESRINSMRFRSGRFTKEDWESLTAVSSRLYELPIFIDDSPSLSYSEIGRRARRLKRKEDVQAIIIDYLGLAQGDKQNGRVEEVSSISRGFKAMAKELNIPIIALHQLNRSCEQRDNKHPRLSDLRDSGAIEQDADLVLFLYRDEVYYKDSKHKGKAELIIAKQRNGPTGTVYLTWIETITRFEPSVNG